MRSRLILIMVLACFADVYGARGQALGVLRGDAPLFDVSFLANGQHGWAVGGRGAIWATVDGGKTWLPQESGTDATLRSVSFLSAKRGFAAGGAFRPLAPTSSAVLLETSDGGATWTAVRTAALPALRKIQFFDGRRGWAVGDPSAIYPSGVFTTEDGGYNWSPIADNSGARWTASEFIDPTSGLLLSARGEVGFIEGRIPTPGETVGRGLARTTGLKLVPGGDAFVIGDGGLLQTCVGPDQPWSAVAAPLPPGVDGFDWRTIDAGERDIWIGGSPGSLVLHSPDGGRTWDARPTGQPLPIHAIRFIDDKLGWAVGALGLILRTEDGGRSWQPVQGASRRAAVLTLAPRAADIPWEAIARLSGEEGCFGAVRVVLRDEASDCDDRLTTAALAAGASAAEIDWRFPCRDASLQIGAATHLTAWNDAHAGQARAALIADLVQSIRTWRPDVVLTSAPSENAQGLDALIAECVVAAVGEAADPRSCPEQLTGRRLAPWQVKKVYGHLTGEARGGTQLATSQFAPRLGRSLAEAAAEARVLLGDATPAPPLASFNLLADRSAGGSESDLLGGLAIEPGGPARRPAATASATAPDMLRAAQRTRNLEAILTQQAGPALAEAQLLAQLNTLTSDLDPARAAGVLHRLASNYQTTGRWPLAAETLEQLVERYPADRYAGAALVWLVQYYASGEAQARVDRNAPHGAPEQLAAGDAATFELNPAQTTSGDASGTVEQAVALDPATPTGRAHHLAQAIARLRALDPCLAEEHSIRFPLAAYYRANNRADEIEKLFAAVRRGGPDDPWTASMDAERWLATRRGASPKPLWPARRAIARPKLDGDLSDDVWKQAEPATLASPNREDAQWPAVALIAYDDEFLYLAASCRRAPGANYDATPGPRPRDPDLSARDAVTWTIDLDRDWVTAYELTIDHRGWCAERCWGDATWNPAWYVAAVDRGNEWIVEAAIPLAELTVTLPAAGSVWAIGAQRLVPGVGFQSLSPAATPGKPLPAGGLLTFE